MSTLGVFNYCYNKFMTKYRRNIDENIREAERQWIEHQDRTSGLNYANQLLRSGQLELTAFPLEIIREMFPSGTSDIAILYGTSVGDILENLKAKADIMMQSAGSGSDLAALRQTCNPMYATTTLVWFPESKDLSLRLNWKQFNRDNIRINAGEIDEESLSYVYRALQVDFTLPGHDSENPPFYAFHYTTSGDSITDYFGYFDEQLGRENSFLVLKDEIPGDWNAAPSVSYGRCEDYPCCGHDTCPPRSDGVQLAMVCTCGRLVLRNASSSLCEGCLRGVRHEAYYGEEEYFEPGDDDDDDDDDDDEDDDGSSGPFEHYEDSDDYGN